MSTPVFELSELATGSHAHGFGHVGDGRQFAFRVRSNLALVEIYQADAEEAFPLPEDVEAAAQCSVIDVDLTDEPGVQALVRDLVAQASPVDGAGDVETTVRTFLSRLDSVVDGG